jgi:hypothetical protein
VVGMKPGHQHQGALHGEVGDERDERLTDQSQAPALAFLRNVG